MSEAIKSEGASLYIDTGQSPTVWVEVGEVAGVDDIDSGEADEIEVTHLKSPAKEYLLGLKDGGTVTLDGNLVANDAGQVQMRAARDTQGERGFRVTLADGTIIRFQALVKKFSTSVRTGQKVPFNSSLRVTGDVDWI